MEREKALLAGVRTPAQDEDSFLQSLEELVDLADTAGIDVHTTVTQKRRFPDRACYIGKGKALEMAEMLEDEEIQIVIFDQELSPVQQRNLEDLLRVRVIDRTALILDIFALRASSLEGKLQVELAGLEYRLPRLTGRGADMSRQVGGMQTRGAGEQKLEIDRRHIRRRIHEIKRKLREVNRTREVQQQRRKKNELFTVSLIGYTNAGKSTLFNRLYQTFYRRAEKQTAEEDRLFKTLDITTRAVEIDGKKVLFSDTVGFIRHLPHHLVAAFKSTLKEAVQADLLLHVVDASHPYREQQAETVEQVLRDLQAGDRPTIVVWNKADRLQTVPYLRDHEVWISARDGTGIECLVEKIHEHMHRDDDVFRLYVPFAKAGELSRFYGAGDILEKVETDDGWEIKLRMSKKEYGKWQPLIRSYLKK